MVACIVVKACPVALAIAISLATFRDAVAAHLVSSWAYQVVVACGRTELEEDLLLTSHLGPQSLPPSLNEPLHAFQ